jgi:hydrogenase maturation protein HypF
VKVFNKEIIVPIRRARGYAPLPIEISFKLKKKTLAVGGHKKNTFALAFDNKVVLSQHIGDLDNLETQEFFKEAIETFLRLYEFQPELVVCDLHPYYFSTQWAEEWAKERNIPLRKVQHHYAHALSLLADNNFPLDKKLLVAVWDGTGYGLDGKIWGGEFIEASYGECQRKAHLKYYPLLGGEKAIKEPRRVALSFLFELYGEDTSKYPPAILRAFKEKEISNFYKLYSNWKKGKRVPFIVETSSMGRLFDGVASLLNIVHILSYEGQSGAIMEDLYQREIKDFYPFEILEENSPSIYNNFSGFIIDWRPIIEALLEDKNPLSVKVSRFINTLAEIICVMAEILEKSEIGLSGGVFYNSALVENILHKAKEKNLNIYLHSRVPSGDGGLALGQAVFQNIKNLLKKKTPIK